MKGRLNYSLGEASLGISGAGFEGRMLAQGFLRIPFLFFWLGG